MKIGDTLTDADGVIWVVVATDGEADRGEVGVLLKPVEVLREQAERLELRA